MVNRVLELKTDVGANGTDVELGRETPREGKVFEVQEIYARTESEGEISVEIDERALIEDVDSVFETSAVSHAPERTSPCLKPSGTSRRQPTAPTVGSASVRSSCRTSSISSLPTGSCRHSR